MNSSGWSITRVKGAGIITLEDIGRRPLQIKALLPEMRLNPAIRPKTDTGMSTTTKVILGTAAAAALGLGGYAIVKKVRS